MGIAKGVRLHWMSCDTLSARVDGDDPIGFTKYILNKNEVKKGKQATNVKLFKLNFGADPRYWLIMNEGRKDQWLAQLSKSIDDWRSRFFIDKRTRSVRNEKYPNHCLSNQKNAEFAQGKKA